MEDIGSTDDTALLCHTNRLPSNSDGMHSGGVWVYKEAGESLTGSKIKGFGSNRGSMVVRLFRRSSHNQKEGIYFCRIPDASESVKIVSVGLYNSVAGKVYTCLHCAFCHQFCFFNL